MKSLNYKDYLAILFLFFTIYVCFLSFSLMIDELRGFAAIADIIFFNELVEIHNTQNKYIWEIYKIISPDFAMLPLDVKITYDELSVKIDSLLASSELNHIILRDIDYMDPDIAELYIKVIYFVEDGFVSRNDIVFLNEIIKDVNAKGFYFEEFPLDSYITRWDFIEYLNELILYNQSPMLGNQCLACFKTFYKREISFEEINEVRFSEFFKKVI